MAKKDVSPATGLLLFADRLLRPTIAFAIAHPFLPHPNCFWQQPRILSKAKIRGTPAQTTLQRR
ncbi:hypothetical protein B0H13DRAFT_2335561 [Mycena leptocephala]|nr:hypothetical protein B0H13DRAFT_2335561 [Mycena leptocephala]